MRNHLFLKTKQSLPFTIKPVGVKRETGTSLLVRGPYWKYCHVVLHSTEESDQLYANLQ